MKIVPRNKLISMRNHWRFLQRRKKKLIERESGSRSIRTREEGNNILLQTNPQESQSNNTYHQSCKTLPYGKFILIMVNQEFSYLIISGTPNKEKLQETWHNILDEYSDLIHTDKSDTILQIYKKMQYNIWKQNFLAATLDTLKDRYDEEVALMVCNLGYDLIQPLKDRELYLRQIYMIEIESQNLVVLLNQYYNEYKRLCPEGEGNTEIGRTEMDYEKELAILSKFYGSRIKKNKITVFEVCGIINAYFDDCKAKIKKNAS